MSWRQWLLLACCLLAACVAAPGTELASIRRGMFVESSGDALRAPFSVSKIKSIPRAESDKSGKSEMTAPVQFAGPATMRALGVSLLVDERTEYEVAGEGDGEPFVARAGDWVRLKLRQKADGSHRVRTVRLLEPRDRFKLTGEVHQLEIANRTIDIGGVRLPVAQDVELLLDVPQNANDPLSLFLSDDQKSVPLSIQLGDSVRLGGQVAGEYEWNDEFDLDDTADNDRSKYSARGKLDVLWALDDRGSYAFGEVSFGRSDRLRQNRASTVNETLQLTRGFVSLRLADNVQLLAGRQDFDEGREWVHDEVLDGVRAIWQLDNVRLEVAAAVGRDVLAETNDQQDRGMLLARGSIAVTEDWRVSGYVLQRTDATPDDFEPTYFGVQSQNEPRHGLGHWFEYARARGDIAGQSVKGYGGDIGATYALDLPGRPTFAVGYAFGSGRTATDSSVGFRQSGLQDNTGKLGGVTSVRYYGELVDPELANMSVSTVAFAFRPMRNASISVLLHGYRQDVASTMLVDTSLRVAPAGQSRALGTEVDLVLAYRLARRLTIELVAGRFVPGSAFTRDATANIFVITSRFSF
ncbi:MAG: hypothetical protein ACI9S9_002350 [Planctomycetota bacterium]